MWRWWVDYWQSVPGSDKIVGILNGDAVEGDYKKRSSQVITRNKSNILGMAIETLEPMLDVCDEIYILRGTNSHTGLSAELEEELARDITISIKAPKTASWWYLEHVCEGVKIFAAHHTTGGRLPWTFSNAAGRNAAEAVYYYSKIGQPPPDLLLYSHLHLFANSGKGNHLTHCLHTPGWQMRTSYTYRKPLGLADIGGLYIVCDQGEYTWEKKTYQPTAKVWKTQI